MQSKTHKSIASLIWTDPGATTGVCVLSLDPKWLDGQGDADWAGLKRAFVSAPWLAQLGDDARNHDSQLWTPEVRFNGPKVAEQTANELSMIYALRLVLDHWPSAAWGYEDYIPESMAAAQKDALVPMRVFSTLAFSLIMDDSRPRVPFVQSRTMKTSASNERMKIAGLYVPGLPHGMDAARHAAVFARACRQKRALRSLAWPTLFE